MTRSSARSGTLRDIRAAYRPRAQGLAAPSRHSLRPHSGQHAARHAAVPCEPEPLLARSLLRLCFHLNAMSTSISKAQILPAGYRYQSSQGQIWPGPELHAVWPSHA